MAVRPAWLEVISGIAAFAIALLTWAIWLFAPVYGVREICGSCPRFFYISLVDSEAGLGNFVRQSPRISLFILAFLVVAAVVAGGAYLHGRHGVPAGRLLVWGGSLLLPLGASAIATLPVMYMNPFISARVDPFSIGLYTVILSVGPGLCAALALIASLAAMRAEDARRQSREGARREGTMAVRPAWLEVISGIAAFAIALLTWAIWLFAPLRADGGSGDHVIYAGLVSMTDGLGNFVRQSPRISLFILAFLVVAAVVAGGAYLHGRHGVPAGRLLVWGGSLLLPLGAAANSALPLMYAVPFELELVTPFSIGLYTVILSVGPGLCAALALIASLAAMRAEDARRQVGH